MTEWIGLGFIALLGGMGLVDTRHGRGRVARPLGALAILAACGLAGFAVWQTLHARAPLSPVVVGGAGAVLVVIGATADAFGELRTRSFTAALTVLAFALLLPSSIGDTPQPGGVLFLAFLCAPVSSLIGAIVRRVIGRFLWDDDEDDEDEEGEAVS